MVEAMTAGYGGTPRYGGGPGFGPPAPPVSYGNPAFMRPRAGTTIASGVIGIVLSAIMLAIGLFIMLMALIVDDLSDDAMPGVDDAGDALATIMIVAGLIVSGCAAWSIIACANLIRRRPWARMAVIVTFSIWSILSGLGVIGALSDQSNSGGILSNLVWLAGCVLTVVFAAVHSTKADVEANLTGSFAVQPPPPGFGPMPPQARPSGGQRGYGDPTQGPGLPPPPPR